LLTMNNEALNENLIGYLLKALDDDTSAKVEAQLQADSDARWRLEQLRLALEPLAADKGQSVPPDDLAVRTIARVAEYCCLHLPSAPAAVCRPALSRSWWRRADIVVAASLLLLV